MAQWIFDIDSEKIVTHPDHFVVEGTHPHVSERILDSDGGIELEMAVFEKYRRQAFGPLYRWNDGYHMTPQGIRDRADADNSDYTSSEGDGETLGSDSENDRSEDTNSE